MKYIFSIIRKKLIAPLFMLFALSACMSTPKLDAYVDKTDLTRFDTFNYTVVYQGYAEKNEFPFDKFDPEYKGSFSVEDIDYQVDSSIVDNEEKFVTTWRAQVVVFSVGKREIPSLELHDLKTPTLYLNVAEAPIQPWADWELKPYKTEVTVNEKVVIHSALTLENASGFYNSMSITPNDEYEHVAVKGLQFYYTNCCTTLNSLVEFSFDAPGVYSISPVGLYRTKVNDGVVSSEGTNAPKFTITVK